MVAPLYYVLAALSVFAVQPFPTEDVQQNLSQPPGPTLGQEGAIPYDKKCKELVAEGWTATYRPSQFPEREVAALWEGAKRVAKFRKGKLRYSLFVVACPVIDIPPGEKKDFPGQLSFGETNEFAVEFPDGMKKTLTLAKNLPLFNASKTDSPPYKWNARPDLVRKIFIVIRMVELFEENKVIGRWYIEDQDFAVFSKRLKKERK
jgi:hypothetical protein